MASFIENLNRLGVEHRPGKSGIEFRICCPFCIDRGESEDTRFRLGVNVKTGQANCFNCRWASRDSGPTWILRQLGTLAEWDASEEVEEERVVEKVEKPRLPDDFELLCDMQKEDGPGYHARRYMVERGIPTSVLRKKKIGVSLVGRFAYRIIFPVYWRKKFKGLIARDYTGRAKIKYLNSKGAKYLFNLPRHVEGVVLSEGVFKALAIEIAVGVPSASMQGHALTDEMINQLEEAGCTMAIVWPDPDRAGIVGAKSVCDKLKACGIESWIIWPAPPKQADELSKKRLRFWYNRATRYTWTVESKIAHYLAFGPSRDGS